MKTKSFECPKSIRNYEKNNAWNIRHLVDESFVPATQRTSVLYCRLLDLWPMTAISMWQSRKDHLKGPISPNLILLDNLKYFRIMHKLPQWLKMLKDWKYSTCDQNTNWKGCICQIVRRGNFPPVCTEWLILIQTKVSWHVAVSFDLLDLLNM